ncbi:MAG: phosphoribosylanthranilate isomerase [Desulfatiglans sp.]|jgi:phosphoribosylanthranilate isomerase|nr:phosphoribosylanthranilate isomerase [Desulfatiglans sp.]
MKVKICGITSLQDALLAAKLGFDAVGFIFAKSPRKIPVEEARDIIQALPPFIKSVGVFVNEEVSAIKEIVRFCGLDLIQLHGDESPSLCDALMPRSIKAFQVRNQSSLQTMGKYRGKVRALLLDAYAEAQRGGTGRTFDWDLADKAKGLGVPIILSGGLGPSNIKGAVSAVRPYAVDVNSGVEETPGKKDPLLMEELMSIVKSIAHGDL